MFHKEGSKIIFISILLMIATVVLADYFIPIFWLQKTVQLLALALLVTVLQFFRNPQRITQLNDNHIIAPVDGKVVVIEEST